MSPSIIPTTPSLKTQMVGEKSNKFPYQQFLHLNISFASSCTGQHFPDPSPTIWGEKNPLAPRSPAPHRDRVLRIPIRFRRILTHWPRAFGFFWGVALGISRGCWDFRYILG